MPFNHTPPSPHPICPSSLDEFARPEIAAELARREQRLAASAQPVAAAATPAVARKAVPPAQSTVPTATAPAALMIRASKLESWPINWVWPGRIAQAKLTLLAGAPGSGKSALAMSIIAAVTTGGRYPCDEGSAPKGSVILLAPGGDPDVLVPRLKAAGADLEHVHVITEAPGPDEPRPFDFTTDLPLLDTAIRSVEDLCVVIVDAVNLSGGRAAEQLGRGVLDRLAILAKGDDIPILALVQTASPGRGGRKPTDLDALTLGTARAAFVIEADPADVNRKLLLQAKNELARDPGTVAFRIAEQEINADKSAARIEFEPQHHSLSADEFTARQARGFNSARAEAFELLRGLLNGASELAIGQVEQEARAAGLIKDKQALNQCRVLRDARMAMGLALMRDARDSGAWVWAKPNARTLAVASPPLQPVQARTVAQLKPSSPNAAM
jgi:putative DNA primase/helicase